MQRDFPAAVAILASFGLLAVALILLALTDAAWLGWTSLALFLAYVIGVSVWRLGRRGALLFWGAMALLIAAPLVVSALDR